MKRGEHLAGHVCLDVDQRTVCFAGLTHHQAVMTCLDHFTPWGGLGPGAAGLGLLGFFLSQQVGQVVDGPLAELAYLQAKTFEAGFEQVLRVIGMQIQQALVGAGKLLNEAVEHLDTIIQRGAITAFNNLTETFNVDFG